MLGLLGIRLKKVISNDSKTWTIVPDSPETCTTSQNTNILNSSERIQFKAGSSDRYEIMEVDWTEGHEKDIQHDKFEESDVHNEVTVQNSKFKETEIHKALLEQSQSIQEQTFVNTTFSTPHNRINNDEEEKQKTNNVKEKANIVEEEAGSEEEPFSSDDSIADLNYLSESSTSSSSEERIPLAALQENEVEAVSKQKTRKRKAIPSEWKRNKIKLLRNSGQAYSTLNEGKHIAARQMKMPCDNNCRLKCTIKFSEQEREALFRQYWNLADISKIRAFLATLTQQINPKYTYPILVNGKRNRTNNNAFYFEKDNIKIRVCKVFFVSTLGITNRCIRSFIEKRTKGDFDDKRGRHGNQKLVPENVKNDIRAHINSIPKIESHYTRAHTEKEYIEGGKTFIDLYRDYKSLCQKVAKHFANVTMYRHIFNYEFNLSFFIPKKDPCHRCVAYDNVTSEERNELEETYLIHLQEKQLSREEKQADKEIISEQYQVTCFDLQATLPTPQGNVSTFYYKSKLSTYNFTVCDLTKRGLGSVTCFTVLLYAILLRGA